MSKLFELTDQQKNIWNSEMFYNGTNMNNIGGYILINEKINLNLLEKAANIYVENTEVARYSISLKDGNPMQTLKDFSPFKLKIVSLNTIDDLYKLTTELVSKPFDILNSNLYNFTIFKLPDGRGGIIPIFHHLITDAWSMSLFISEFINIYSNLLKDNNEFSTYPSYSEYIETCKDYKQSKKYEKDKEYWNEVFSENPDLTYISKKREISSSHCNRKIYEFDNSFYNEISEYCKDHKCSIYTFFMAIFSIYLAKINSTSSAILGTPVLNRSNFKEKNTSGMFVSTVPFKIDIDSNLTFEDFLNKVSLNQSSIFRHQKYPYLELLSNVKEKFDISENLYDFVLSYQNARDNKDSVDINYESFWEPTSNISESIEAHFYDMDGTGKANIYYYYQTEKFTEKDIELLQKRVISICKQVLNGIKLQDIDIICKEDKLLIDKFNDTNFSYDKKETLIDIFEKQVKSFPDKKAVIFKDTYITYKELDEKSNMLANYLLSKNIGKNDVVGIMFKRSLDLHISIWGILKAGATYMLIDPSLPEDRVNYMLENSNAKLVITDLYINYENINLKICETFKNTMPKIKTSNEDSFCIIYTSRFYWNS